MITGAHHKSRALYIGSFKLVKSFTNSYKIELPKCMKIHPIFDLSQLKLYHVHKVSGNHKINLSQSFLKNAMRSAYHGRQNNAKIVKVVLGKFTLVPIEAPAIHLQLLKHDLQISLMAMQGGGEEKNIVHGVHYLQ